MRYWPLLLIALGCSGSDSQASSGGGPLLGPAGAYDDYRRCATWSGGAQWCPDAKDPNMFVCDSRPGDPCVQSTQPTPSENQEVWCCSFPCARGAPSSDGWCTGAKTESYICYGNTTDVAKQLGCDLSSEPNIICC